MNVLVGERILQGGGPLTMGMKSPDLGSGSHGEKKTRVSDRGLFTVGEESLVSKSRHHERVFEYPKFS